MSFNHLRKGRLYIDVDTNEIFKFVGFHNRSLAGFQRCDFLDTQPAFIIDFSELVYLKTRFECSRLRLF